MQHTHLQNEKPGSTLPLLVIVKRTELCAATGVSKSMLYLKLNPKSKYFDPRFPRPVKIGKRAVGWLLSEVNAYISSLTKA